jgi:mevalonate kinase
LLAGEYSIIDGGSGLLLPLSRFSGSFNFSTIVDDNLIEWCKYISQNEFLNKLIDHKKYKTDIDNGLVFNSNIPTGYGVGSSGALTAAVYDNYAFEKESDLFKLKTILGQIESYFHGKSSGLDALVSLINKPIKIENGEITEWQIDEATVADFYMYESNNSRNTQLFVNYYLDNIINNPLHYESLNSLKEYNNKLINGVIAANQTEIIEAMKVISRLQFEVFDYMIVEELKDDWEYGLASGDYYFKLCGAGGGGFYLCYDMNGWIQNPENVFKL